MSAELFSKFETGKLATRNACRGLSSLPWCAHPTFEGVALKHVVRAADTDGRFSYHLVRIDPGKAIGRHIHETQLETHEVVSGSGVGVIGNAVCAYVPGTIAIMEAGIEHQVSAEEGGLLLFAKFLPALC